jgi:hypothetical protein
MKNNRFEWMQTDFLFSRLGTLLRLPTLVIGFCVSIYFIVEILTK